MDHANFRNTMISEPRVFGPQQGIQTAIGRVPMSNGNSSSSIQQINGIQPQQRSTNMQLSSPPPLPPRPYNTMNNAMYPSFGGMGMYGGTGMYSNSMYGAYSGYGMNPYSGYGMNRFGGAGMYGSAYGMRDPMDPETRFIQLAEESSRPAFQSIESLVMAIGNIAAMLDSTFFALTSSFRAILGVAANFGQLRGVFAQFWQTFALIRGVSWLYKKLLYLLGISKVDPTTVRFNEIFSAAASGDAQINDTNRPKKVSVWPILTFLGFIFATPYLIMKLIGQVSTTAIEESKNPMTWVQPYAAQAIHSFKSTAPHELSVYAGQMVKLAPREVQQTHKLLNTGWALATVDNKTSGLIPINYVQRLQSKTVPTDVPMTVAPAPTTQQTDANVLSEKPIETSEDAILEQFKRDITTASLESPLIDAGDSDTSAIKHDAQEM